MAQEDDSVGVSGSATEAGLLVVSEQEGKQSDSTSSRARKPVLKSAEVSRTQQ